jgi:hypothetical protein
MVCFTVYSCYCENSHFDFEYPSRTNCSFDGLGMRKTSFGWESGVPAGHRLWCLPLFFRVTACTLGSLQPQLMLLPQTAASLFSTIPGNLDRFINILHYYSSSLRSTFTELYVCRACPSEFVIPLSKYIKAVFHTRISVGMRFRMLFETEESSVRRWSSKITKSKLGSKLQYLFIERSYLSAIYVWCFLVV